MTTTAASQAATPRKRVVKVSPVTIAAAQLRMTLDKKLGRPTPVIAAVARASGK